METDPDRSGFGYRAIFQDPKLNVFYKPESDPDWNFISDFL